MTSSLPGEPTSRQKTETRDRDLPEDAHDGVVKLYGAHHQQAAARLGPALFMPLPRYIRQGLAGQDERDSLVRSLLAEAYLVSVGTWLSKLRPEDLALLRDEIVNVRGVFDEAQWEWIAEMSTALG